MSEFFHVSSVLNRESIQQHGLDSARMGAAPGIAGSRDPEADGVFICTAHHHLEFFIRMNNTGGPLDVWSVLDVDESLLREYNGFFYLPGSIPPSRVRLVRKDVPQSDLSRRMSY